MATAPERGSVRTAPPRQGRPTSGDRRRWLLGAVAAPIGMPSGASIGTGLTTALGAFLTACGKRGPDFTNLDITDSRDFDPRFALPDAQGTVRTIADWRGKVVVLLFGYAQCPDVCPTSLAELARAKARLGADGERLQVVFVTVDPMRDTPAVLKEYVRAFDPSFVALRPADDAAVQQLAKQFHIYVAKTPVPGAAAASTASGTDYGIAHTAVSFVFDPQGRLRLYAKDGEGVDRWIHDVRLLLAPAPVA